MILIADGGSTKTEWRLVNEGTSMDSVFTAGINPYFLNSGEMVSLLSNELSSIAHNAPEKIWFYGTGCNGEIKNNIVKQALFSIFPGSEIMIGSDLLGAARSLCLTNRGIACIIGTGSNSCYYDGKEIAANVSPLGYILGDEGGGAVLGRKLLSGVLKNQFGEQLRRKFFESYPMTKADILDAVYMKPFPNRFLGQFARFISSNIEYPELQEILISGFNEFIIRNILQYPESKDLPVHFTGSIAWHFRSFLERSLQSHNLKLGTVSLTPVEGLVKYHTLLNN